MQKISNTISCSKKCYKLKLRGCFIGRKVLFAIVGYIEVFSYFVVLFCHDITSAIKQVFN